MLRTLNLGILAHVDAGKTTLTERLLYAAGVIDAPGSVDHGTTRTDTLPLERQRGITIKAAVVSFPINGVTVNLIDTPGHPDFIAEVERVLNLLDGAVLVISAVEGVQPQTRVLMRTLQRLRVPTLLFVNKVDRAGADHARTLTAIAEKLTAAAVAMDTVHDAGRAAARVTARTADDAAFRERLTEVLAEHDAALLAAYVEGAAVPFRRLRRALMRQSRRALVHPVFSGSALTGAGVEALIAGIREFLPATAGAADGPLSGTVFKVERGRAGETIAYARLFSGTLRTRDRLALDREREGKVTAIGVFERGGTVPRTAVAAGQIARLWGLGDVRIGDTLGEAPPVAAGRHFAPPTLETVVLPSCEAERGRLRAALAQLAEQDPLIDLRQDDLRRELSVSLYGEVQKEVIQATLAAEYGLAVEFRETTTICIERPAGVGAALEVMRRPPNPFLATVGLRVEPAPIGSGVCYRRDDAVLGTMPPAFFKAVEESARETLRQGLSGWQVTDCAVTLTHTGYAPRQSHAHQGFSKSMSSTGWDFRGLTPLVLTEALRQAGTRVYEPVHRYRLELPAECYTALLPVLVALEAAPRSQEARGAASVLAGDIPAGNVAALQQQLPALSRGEGVLETSFDRYEPVTGAVPTRPRTDHNPLDRKQYLLHVLRRV